MRISDWSSDGCSSDLATSPRSSRLRASSLLSGKASRTSSATASLRCRGSKPGTVPLPSFTWQPWQDRALNKGPKPSDACVDDGEDTQSLRNKPLPTMNSWRPSKSQLAAGCEQISALISLRHCPARSEECRGGAEYVGSM